ncbi:MAG: trypsin-like peptidase domain-containing protein [Burkholderiales bacterium]|jgi:2-alkenal reductase|nr:trypsin-like peptidase domain-containing protein [Burkholderiales bacterium]MBP7519494.1 trypsin-like peptidase domain-containing protein [Leptothrix sp. (in: b-proteobacteria)]HQY10387.1 trypsin-like peptidase domain-containing protein [Burkholderiaceae bacterium]
MSSFPHAVLRRGSALLALVTLVSMWAAGASQARDASPRSVSPRGALQPDEQAVVNLFEQAAPSVAYITTESEQRNLFGSAEVSQGAGSGFVWDAQGHIVTNFHVVQGARRVFVQLDAGKPIPAEPVGGAPEYDLAVIRLSRVPKDLRPIPLGSSRDLKIGQAVYAIGNPFGLQRTLTKGLVSALDRELPTANFREVVGVIQTDAAINPGNSGGPLMDSAGRLIGVNSAIRSASGSSSGIGFAIPADLVNRVVPSLINKGRAPLPGIGVTPMRPDLVARAGLSGVVLAEVGRGTPAAAAGLRPFNRRTGELGDVIVGVNGRPVDTLSTFVTELERAGIQSTVELTVRRDEQERRVKVKVIDLRE